MKILIDNGHGIDTVGKQSPDGILKEWEYTREIAFRLERELTSLGLYAVRIVPGQYDLKLRDRCRKVNALCSEVGAENALLVSIHNNAAGMDGKWHGARGFSAHVSMNASAKSKALAKYLWDAALTYGLRGNRSIPKCGYLEQNLAICRDTKCPAVLTENLFQDNAEDVEYLMSEEGIKTIVQMHVEGIENYLKIYG